MLSQNEIDSISKEFLDAWTNYFGQEMYYIKCISQQANNIYKEVKSKQYDEENKILFHGTLKEKPVTEKEVQSGKRVLKMYEIVIVTKELEDAGINDIDLDDIIEVPLKNGNVLRLEITSKKQKFQLLNNKIFTIVEGRCYE